MYLEPWYISMIESYISDRILIRPLVHDNNVKIFKVRHINFYSINGINANTMLPLRKFLISFFCFYG